MGPQLYGRCLGYPLRSAVPTKPRKSSIQVQQVADVLRVKPGPIPCLTALVFCLYSVPGQRIPF